MPSAYAKASKATAYRLDRIAATENAEAFSDEHKRQGDHHLRAIPTLWKLWDATLDRRTCPICNGHEGDMVHFGRDFDGGYVPGAAHANCRCREGTIFLPLGYSTEDDES